MEKEEKKVKIFLPNGFIFTGSLIDESESFIIIIDERSKRQRTFNKKHVESWEVGC